MDIILAIRHYVLKMIDESGAGMKALLMDKETTSIISVVYAQSEILQKEVFLFEKIEGNVSNESMRHVTCIVFIRPTSANVSLLAKELKTPRYGSYYIYFSNAISRQDVKLLAEADDHEVVKEVKEFYGDYIAISGHLMTLNIHGCSEKGGWVPTALQRSVQGLTALLLSLKKCPIIRYQSSSEMAKKLADNVKQVLTREAALFDFRKSEVPPLLLILDRKDDPVTPLLNQWTYQAMMHELIGINNNRMSLVNIPNVPKDIQDVVLSCDHDDFYAKNLYLNFGEIGSNIKDLMEEFQHKSKNQAKVESISDMKNFIETYPAFKKMSGAVSKHVTIVSELSRLVAAHRLMDVSECEQELACHSDHSASLQKIKLLIDDERTRELDKLRLVLLYALRYEKHTNNDIAGLVTSLRRKRLDDTLIKMVQLVLEYGGQRTGNEEDPSFQNPVLITKKFLKGLKGVENIYTQHKPYLLTTLDLLLKGKLKESNFSYVGSSQLKDKPQDVIIFMVGGATFEESAAIHSFNQSQNSCRVILASTAIHNTFSFLEEVSIATKHLVGRQLHRKT